MSLNLELVRKNFPALDQKIHGHPLVYLDNAASTLKSRKVIDAINNHYSKDTANIHRGVHYLSEKGTKEYEATREKVTAFINAEKSLEIIFTKGTTDSINLVATSLSYGFLKEGDEILVSTMEHHSNIVPWQMAAKRTGAKLVEIQITDDGQIDLEQFKKVLSNKTKIVAMGHISNSLGTINPIKEVIDLAHEKNALVLIDGAQAIAHTKVDVQKLNCDFYCFSSHKLYGPTGVGVLYGKEELLNKMTPYQGGGDMIDIVTIEETTYNELPFKFEAGTPHIAGVITLKSAIDFIEQFSWQDIESHENELTLYATKKMESIPNLKILGPDPKHKIAVISFIIKDIHHHDLGTLLDNQGIAVRTGHHCTQPLMERFGITGTTRASFSIYNTKKEVDKLVSGIAKALELLG